MQVMPLGQCRPRLPPRWLGQGRATSTIRGPGGPLRGAKGLGPTYQPPPTQADVPSNVAVGLSSLGIAEKGWCVGGGGRTWISDQPVSGGPRGSEQERPSHSRGQAGRASWKKCHLGPVVVQAEAGRGAPIESTGVSKCLGFGTGEARGGSTHVFWEQERVFRSSRTLDVLQSKVTVKAGVRMSECPGRGRLALSEGCFSRHLAVHAGPSLEATWCLREGWDLRSAGVRSPVLHAVWPWAGLAPPLSRHDDLPEDPAVLRIHGPPLLRAPS